MSNTSTLASQRLAALLDENSFMEIGRGVTARSTDFDLSAAHLPSDGVVTGHGLIDGNLVFVYSQDPTVLGGTIGEMHAKKIARVYDMAMRMGAPVIGLLDSGGIRLQESYDALSGLGELFRKAAEASGVVPQVAVVMGNCGGGMSIIPALADFTFVEKEKGRLFLNPPDAVEGNNKAKCDTASAAFQAEETGNVDMTGTESEIFDAIRSLIPMLPDNNDGRQIFGGGEDDANRSLTSMEQMAGDARYLFAEMADDHLFFETKRDFGTNLVTGFLRLNGTTVGVLAPASERYDDTGKKAEDLSDVLNVRGVQKATALVRFCDAFEVPVLTLVNTKGFCHCMNAEKNMAREMAAFVSAYASATVPKVTLYTKEAFGSAGMAIGSKAIGADLAYAWPKAKISMMDPKQAAKLMYGDEGGKAVEEKAKEYQKLQASLTAAEARGYVDRVIDPADTRIYLIAAFEMLFTKRPDPAGKKHGTK